MEKPLLTVLALLLLLSLPGWTGFASEIVLSDQDPASIVVMSFNIRYGTAGDGENSWDSSSSTI